MNLMFWKKKTPGDTQQGEADDDDAHALQDSRLVTARARARSVRDRPDVTRHGSASQKSQMSSL